jgi:hypothetical protein
LRVWLYKWVARSLGRGNYESFCLLVSQFFT